MSFEAIPFPTGQSSTQIYNWAVSQTSALRRILQELTGGSDDVDLAEMQADIAVLQTDVATIQEQIADMGDELFTPQKAFELDLVTRADGILGSFTGLLNRQQTQREQNADATMQAAIQAAKANTGVRTAVRVMNEQNLQLAERIDTVSADLETTNGNVVTLTQAVADGDTALGTQITDVSSQVAGNTASISQTIASVNGILTQYAVVINAQGEQVGWFKLDGSQQGTVAAFNVDAFTIGKAGTDGGNAVRPFTISIANGVASTVLRGEVLADGAVTARTIAAGAVTADKITANILSAIAANLGTVTAGLLKDAANVYNFDVTNGVLKRTDGTMTIDMKNKVIDITF